MVMLSNRAKERLIGMRRAALLGPNQVWWLEGTPDNVWVTLRQFNGKQGRVLRGSSGEPILAFEKELERALEDRVIDLAENGSGKLVVCKENCG